MSCQRAQEMDLMAFAVDRSSQEWADFRDHYPLCADCSRAVAGLASLESLVRERGSGESAHLDEQQMLAMASEGRTHPGREGLEMHLANCAVCRTELAVLRSFEFDAASEASTTHARRDASFSPNAAEGEGWLGRLGDFVTDLLSPRPGFALAAVVAVAALVVWSMARNDGSEAPPAMAENSGSEQVVEDVERRLTGPEDASIGEYTRLVEAADEKQSFPLLPDITVDQAEEEIAKAPSDSASESLADRHQAPAPIVSPSPSLLPFPTPPTNPEPSDSIKPNRRLDELSGEGEVILLAALLPSDLPRYAIPAVYGGSDLDAIRMAGVTRGSGDARLPRVQVLSPEHIGATRQAMPRLYWLLDQDTSLPIEIVVSNPMLAQPLLEKRMSAPLKAGIHFIDLAREQVQLTEGTSYDWSVSLIPEETSRDSDVVSMAGIRRLPVLSQPAEKRSPEAQARRIHRLAEAGSWYDAYDQVSRWAEQAPDVDRLERYRRSLLEQVGLGSIADWPHTGNGSRTANAPIGREAD